MKLILAVSLLTCSSLIFSACSGGGSSARRGKGTACPRNFDPIPLSMDEKVAKKLSKDGVDSFSLLPTGSYELKYSEILYLEKTDRRYRDNDSQKVITVSLSATKGSDDVVKTETLCLGSITPETKIDASTEGIVGITVNEDKSISFKTAVYSFSFENDKFSSGGQDVEQFSGSPKAHLENFDGDVGVEVYQHVEDGNVYEIRYELTKNKNITYKVSAQFTRTDLAKKDNEGKK